jgi:imidazoleglycerol-phosphate dehydratase
MTDSTPRTDRIAQVNRNTLETKISVSLNLDGAGKGVFNTGVPFLEHMMDQIARHGMIDLNVTCDGDTHIDDKKGIRRYGHAYVPLDEALSRVVIDFSGRPGLVMQIPFTQKRVGQFDVELFWEFFQGFVNHAGVTLHVDNLRGHNAHHQIETVFKAFGRALRMALELDPRMEGIMPSTKGSL